MSYLIYEVICINFVSQEDFPKKNKIHFNLLDIAILLMLFSLLVFLITKYDNENKPQDINLTKVKLSMCFESIRETTIDNLHDGDPIECNYNMNSRLMEVNISKDELSGAVDVKMITKLETEQINGSLFFCGDELKLGNKIYLATNLVEFCAYIVEVDNTSLQIMN